MATKRKALSKKTRFEVFKRDELLKEIAIDATSWTDWKNGMYNAIAMAQGGTP